MSKRQKSLILVRGFLPDGTRIVRRYRTLSGACRTARKLTKVWMATLTPLDHDEIEALLDERTTFPAVSEPQPASGPASP